MSRIFILAFVLFATLFAVNAAPLELVKRDTPFPPCPDLQPDVVGLDVKMAPDPFAPGQVTTFNLTGTMKKDIVTGDWVGLIFTDLVEGNVGDSFIVDICTLPGVTCLIKAGTVFNTTQEVPAPAAKDLPESYAIIAAIGRGDPPQVEQIACSAAFYDQDPPANLDV